MREKKTLSWLLTAGVLLTVSISYASYTIAAGSPDPVVKDANIGAIQIQNTPNYLNSIIGDLSCEGISFDSGSGQLMSIADVILSDGSLDTTRDDFNISFSNSQSEANAALGALMEDTCTRTIDFTFQFSADSRVDVTALASTAKAYFDYQDMTRNDIYLPIESWCVQGGVLSRTGDRVEPLTADASKKTLTLSVLVSDESNTIENQPYLYTFKDVLTDYRGYLGKYGIRLDLDLSDQSSLTIEDFSDITLEVTTSGGK